MLFTNLNTGYFTFIARLIFTETVRGWEASTDGGTQGHRMSSLCSLDRETSWKAESGAKFALYLWSTFTHQQWCLLSISVPFSIFQEEIASLKLLFHNLLPTLMSCWWIEIFTWLKMNNVGKNTVDPFGAFWLLFKTFLASVSSKSYLSVHILHWHIALLLYKRRCLIWWSLEPPLRSCFWVTVLQ